MKNEHTENRQETKRKAPLTEAALARETGNTLARLKAQPKVRFLACPDGGDRNIVIKLNGTRWVIPKGVEVEMPKDVYALIERKYETLRAADRFMEKAASAEVRA